MVGANDKPGKDATERAPAGNHDAVESNFGASLMNEKKVGDDSWAKRLRDAGTEALEDAGPEHRAPRLGHRVPDAGAEEDGEACDEDGALADLERDGDPEEVAKPQEQDVEGIEVARPFGGDVEFFDERNDGWIERNASIV